MAADSGADFGRSAPLESPRAAGGGRPAPARAGASSLAEDLDDEIPF
jgi:hypothetical protein